MKAFLAKAGLGPERSGSGASSSSSSSSGGDGKAPERRVFRLQSYRTRSETDAECHKLVRMVVSAYYSTKHHREMEIVVDALLQLDTQRDHHVLEEKIADQVRLPVKRVGYGLACPLPTNSSRPISVYNEPSLIPMCLVVCCRRWLATN
jgi:hypothetical protein